MEQSEETTTEAASESATENTGEETVVRVGGLKGPTTMGLVKLMDEAANGESENSYEFTMVTAADEMTAMVAGGKVDIALLPANVASVLYNKTNKNISVIDINTLGVLYFVSADSSVTTIDQLKGKTVYLPGKGTTPEYALRYVLSAAGLGEDDVTLEFKSEASEVASVLAEDPNAIGLLPQPFVTAALAQNEKLSIIMDLTKEWDNVQGEGSGSRLVTGVTIVNNDFLKEHEDLVDTFLQEHEASIAFTAEDCHRYGSPNCEAAGKQGALMGLESMLSINGGKGKFVNGLGGAPGVKALVIGGGVVGRAAISVLHALGAWVTVMDINIGTLRDIGKQFNEEVNTQISNRYNLKKILPEIDVVYNCVRWPKDAKEYMIDREMVRSMEKGSVIVDISNDYGAIETFHETTHENPRYIEEGVVHYCVSNIPGAISQSTSIAYAASVLPHFRSIINNGVAQACAKDGFLRRSLTTYKGYLTHEETSAIQGRPWVRPEDILEIADQKLDLAPSTTKSHSDNFIKLEK